jgi:hypothetical protein
MIEKKGRKIKRKEDKRRWEGRREESRCRTYTFQKFYSKWTTDLNIKCETIKHKNNRRKSRWP